MGILPQYDNERCEVLMHEKKRIHNSSKTISKTSWNNNYFKILSSILLNCSFKTFKISKIYLT